MLILMKFPFYFDCLVFLSVFVGIVVYIELWLPFTKCVWTLFHVSTASWNAIDKLMLDDESIH